MTIGPAELAAMLEAIAQRIATEREALNRLDAALGDGDHGTSISAAFTAAVEAIAALDQPSASDVWLAAAKALMNRMGGASGAIFGSFFLKGVAVIRGRDSLNKRDMDAVLAAGLQGVQARGKAQVGDKTMVDALAPAVAAFALAGDYAAGWRSAAVAARIGADSTRELTARRGRARYLGVRASGHVDPGAMTIALLFEAIDDWWRSNCTTISLPPRTQS